MKKVRLFEQFTAQHTVNEAVAKNTKVYQIATPAPRAILAGELEDLFGTDYRHIVTEFDDDERYESVLVFNLTKRDIKRIQEEIADVLIWEYSIKRGKEISESLTEANRGKVHKAAKQGSYPAVVVVVQDGKVIHQESVSSPEVAPATFNVMQEKYPKATIHLEDKTGQRLFSESVTESVFSFKTDNIEQLHFETDPKTAEEMKIELGKKQGEVSKRKQIESGEYSLRRFRKEIGYGNGKDVGVFLPGSYDASVSKLGDGPHKKAVKAVKWNQKKYDQWLEDMASNGGAENAFDMAQNAKNERGLIDWVKKNFRGDDPLQRIQWDIEAFA